MIRDDPLWYKRAVIYEVHVKAFRDSDADGLGDFRGLTSKLDYIQDLGVTAIWLLPFYPSPLRDDGYDIADYGAVHPDYGTLDDFRAFLDEAHRRGIRVITELVLNHTSDQHPWFQRARRAPAGSPERDFYVWTDSAPDAQGPSAFGEARIIFTDYETSNWTWDATAKAFYWHRFYSHQPDLNYDNPAVVDAMFKVLDFWLALGVDGLRLDAAPYLYEREGTDCENLPETYDFLKKMRKYVDDHFPNRMLLAEANQWPEEAAAYFGDGDACQMAFHFPLMPRMFMAIQMEDRLPIVDIMAQTPAIPETCQWAIFLRNHDELTLEMVTEEERDYMNQVYAHSREARINLGIRRRLGPLLHNNRRRIELMYALLLSLPGTPVLYYGDEIGMGDDIYLGDRNGVRTPMQWGPGLNAGFSDANPQRLYLPLVIDPEFHHRAVNVDVQAGNGHSLLSWVRRVISLRRRHRAFGEGSLEFLSPDNYRILAYRRKFDGETILVVANLSRFVQPVELDLSEFAGSRPVELFGHVDFPAIGELPYPMTLGPHSFYWFRLEPAAEEGAASAEARPEVSAAIAADDPETFLDELLDGPQRVAFEDALREHLSRSGAAEGNQAVRFSEVRDALAIPGLGPEYRLLLVAAEFFEGQPAAFQVPVRVALSSKRADEGEHPDEILRLTTGAGEAAVLDASADGKVGSAIADLIRSGGTTAGSAGEAASDRPRPEVEAADPEATGPARIIAGVASNANFAVGDRFFLKLFRRLEPGSHPEIEAQKFLSLGAGFAQVAPYEGSLTYRRGREGVIALAMLQRLVENRGTTWDLTLESLAGLGDESKAKLAATPLPDAPLVSIARTPIPREAADGLGGYLGIVRLLGRRTAELHQALASRSDDPDFAPEAFTGLYRRSVYQSMRGRSRRSIRLLRGSLAKLPESARTSADELISREEEVLGRIAAIQGGRIAALKTRIHGDFHLGQVLWTGSDFAIIDFEGESNRPIGERRLKRSPVLDVVGLIYSIRYAAALSVASGPSLDGEAQAWVRSWSGWAGASYLGAYLEASGPNAPLPPEDEALAPFVEAYLISTAIDSLRHEVRHRPERAAIPVEFLLERLALPS